VGGGSEADKTDGWKMAAVLSSSSWRDGVWVRKSATFESRVKEHAKRWSRGYDVASSVNTQLAWGLMHMSSDDNSDM
jgi:hypothetical protein